MLKTRLLHLASDPCRLRFYPVEYKSMNDELNAVQ